MRVKLRLNQYPESRILDAPEGRLGVRPRSCRLLCSVCLRRQLRGRTPRASPPTMQLSLKCNHAFPGQFSQSSSLGALSLTRMPAGASHVIALQSRGCALLRNASPQAIAFAAPPAQKSKWHWLDAGAPVKDRIVRTFRQRPDAEPSSFWDSGKIP
jgi:hypothetical protein